MACAIRSGSSRRSEIRITSPRRVIRSASEWSDEAKSVVPPGVSRSSRRRSGRACPSVERGGISSARPVANANIPTASF